MTALFWGMKRSSPMSIFAQAVVEDFKLELSGSDLSPDHLEAARGFRNLVNLALCG